MRRRHRFCWLGYAARRSRSFQRAVEEKHLRENLAALNVELDAGDMAAIASIGKNERFLTADVF